MGPGQVQAGPGGSKEGPDKISGSIFFSFPSSKNYETLSKILFGSSSDEIGVEKFIR